MRESVAEHDLLVPHSGTVPNVSMPIWTMRTPEVISRKANCSLNGLSAIIWS